MTPDAIEAVVIALPQDFVREIATAMHLMAGGSADEFCGPVLERIAATLIADLELTGDLMPFACNVCNS